MNPPPFVTNPDGRTGYNNPDGTFVELSRADYDKMISSAQQSGTNPLPFDPKGFDKDAMRTSPFNPNDYNQDALRTLPLAPKGYDIKSDIRTLPFDPKGNGYGNSIPSFIPAPLPTSTDPIEMQTLKAQQIPQNNNWMNNITIPQFQSGQPQMPLQKPQLAIPQSQNIPLAGNNNGVIEGIKSNLNNATIEAPVDDGTGTGSGGAKNALMGMGANAITGLAQTIAPDTYDQRVGMSKPGLGQFGNLQFTSMGASLGPAGAAVGLGVDAVKNTIGYFKNKQAYNTATNKADAMDWRNKMLSNQQPDYTGLAREGIEVAELVPVELEKSETVIQPESNGSYKTLFRTSDDGPTHEQGGIKLNLPVDALVFPKKYDNKLNKALEKGNNEDNWNELEKIKDLMLSNASKAYKAGKPYSSGGKQ